MMIHKQKILSVCLPLTERVIRKKSIDTHDENRKESERVTFETIFLIFKIEERVRRKCDENRYDAFKFRHRSFRTFYFKFCVFLILILNEMFLSGNFE